jgi:hypothetical protein
MPCGLGPLVVIPPHRTSRSALLRSWWKRTWRRTDTRWSNFVYSDAGVGLQLAFILLTIAAALFIGGAYLIMLVSPTPSGY